MWAQNIGQAVLSWASLVPTPDLNLTELFGPSLSANASIHLPSEANYTGLTTQRWTIHRGPSYRGTIAPATNEDVENIVKIAATNKIPFLATGGGHGATTGLHALKGGLQIDLQYFDDVRLDEQENLLHIGGGTHFSQIIDLMDQAGREFPIGTAPCVGIIGATLGAGVTSNQGIRGLLSDMLQSVDVVTASGSTVKASRRENRDLFWAMRGAGANFGIVTSATYSVPSKAINGGEVVNANYLFSVEQSREVWETLALFDETLPANLAFNIVAAYDMVLDQVIIIVNANYYGAKSEAIRHLEPFLALGPLKYELLLVPWTKVFETSYFGIDDTKACGRNQHVNMRSIAANKTDVSTFDSFLHELLEFSRDHVGNKTHGITASLVVHRWPTQAVLAVPGEDSSYPHRQAKMHIQLESEYEDRHHDDLVDRFLQFARSNFSATSGFDTPLAVYVNFAHGDEGPEAWYGAENLCRLSHLKSKWDPDNLFSFYNAIPSSWP